MRVTTPQPLSPTPYSHTNIVLLVYALAARLRWVEEGHVRGSEYICREPLERHVRFDALRVDGIKLVVLHKSFLVQPHALEGKGQTLLQRQTM